LKRKKQNPAREFDIRKTIKESVLSSQTSKNKLSGVIQTYKKGESASTSAIALNLIKNTYSDSLEYKGSAYGSRGVVIFFGTFSVGLVTFANLALLDVLADRFAWHRFVVIFTALIIGDAVTMYFFLKSLRLELFRPIDEPTIFDRKNRKVYRIFSETKPGWKGLLLRWPLKTATYDWDLVKAEHHVAFNADGSTINRMHALVFSVKKSVSDQTIVDSFMLGNSIHHGEQTVPAVYEHVRKFMEEGGPHLPPGEKVTSIKKPANFWQCMGRTWPYGSTVKKCWKSTPFLAVLALFFFPITIPVFTLIGIFSWLSYATSTPISWPDEVTKAVGAPIDDKE
jgi:hypothetical protein